MAIDSLSTFQTTFKADIIPTKDDSWMDNLTNWVSARVTGLQASGIGGPNVLWVFNSAVFKAGLSAISVEAANGVSGLASSFQSAINASTIVMQPGSFIGSATPANTWSVVSTTMFTPSSVLVGKAKIEELASAPLVNDAINSQFPVKIREAFLLLTIDTSGLDSTPSPGGPLPLIDVGRAVE